MILIKWLYRMQTWYVGVPIAIMEVLRSFSFLLFQRELITINTNSLFIDRQTGGTLFQFIEILGINLGNLS